MKNDALRQLFKPLDSGDGDGKRIKPMLVWVLIIAIVYLAVSSFWGSDVPKEEKATDSIKAQEISLEDYINKMENRLAETLKKVNGAGKVSVFISIESGGEKVLATDNIYKDNVEEEESLTNSQTEEEKKVVLSDISNEQMPYVIEEKLPKISGVLVVAEGALDERVRYDIYEAVRALFGLSAHRIKVTY